MKLRTKIILFILPCWILSIVILQVLSSHFMQGLMHKSISNELDNVTLFVSNNVENTIENASVDLQMCGILPLFNEYLDYKMYGLNEESELIKKEVDFIFENLLEKRYAYLQMMFVDGNNKEIVSTRSPVYKNNNAIEQQQKIVFDEKRKYKKG